MGKDLQDSSRTTNIFRGQAVDLLVLIFSFGVGMALQVAKTQLGLGALFQTEYGWFNAISRTLFAVIAGLPIAALYCFAIARRSSDKTYFQPGHWLLLAMLCSTFATAFRLIIAMFPHWISVFELDAHKVDHALSAFFSIGSACILLLAGIRNRAYWRILLFICALSSILWTAFSIVAFVFDADGVVTGKPLHVLNLIDWVEASLNVIIAVFLAVLAFVEFKNGIQRDLWHWLGVLVASLMVAAAPMIGYIYSTLGV